jgi:TonB family protein
VVAVVPSADPFGASKKVALPNPFAAAPSLARATQEAELDLTGIDPERLVYGIAASGPPVDANEVETAQQALEVMVMWGRSVLHVDHLSPARSFYVGESQSKDEPVDYLLTPEVLGAARLPITLVSEGGTYMVFPAGATGELLRDGERTVIESIMLEPCPAHPGARQLALPAGATVTMQHAGFTFVAKSVRAGRKVAGGFAFDWSPLAYCGAVLATVALLLGVMYFTPPSVAGLSADIVDPNSRLAQFIITPSETEAPVPDETTSTEAGGEASASSPGEPGEMGDVEAPRTNNRASLRGDANPEDERAARDALVETATHAGPIGAVLASMQFIGPTTPYGATDAVGSSDIAALGALTGAQPGSNFGIGGLGLTGTGRGGNYGVVGGLIGSGPIGTHGGCRGARCGGGTGIGDGTMLPDREPLRPVIGTPNPAVTGSLAADAIRRVVRRHLGEVRFCYEQALPAQPDLAGTVSVRFVITPAGGVAASTVAGSTLGSARVESCVASAVRRWTFPQPDNGTVAVTYPFTLSTR